MHNSTAVDENSRIALTTDVVAAYVANNSGAPAELAQLISSVHQTFSALLSPPPPEAETPIPAVSIKKSITPDHIISLEDGKPYKSMKRHLGGRGLTPDAYRSKWGLPHDYPMVAPNYAKRRSEMAKSFGLGQMRRKRAETSPAEQTPPKKARGRPRKSGKG
jgi:predicted transcriptional regulator